MMIRFDLTMRTLFTKDLINEVITYFNTFATNNPYPTNNDGILFMDFFINKLNKCYMSPICEYMFGEVDAGTLTDAQFTDYFINLFENKFYDKYKRLFTIFDKNYNPIENYDMSEDETNSGETGGLTGNSVNTKSSMYAFNSSTPNDLDESTSTTKTSNSGERHLTRHGNIGVTTTTQMIESTVDVYTKYNLIIKIYDDFLSLLTLDII